MAAFFAVPFAVPEPGSRHCAGIATSSSDGMVCLGDGSLLDPSTSLVWRQGATGTGCAAIDPLADWRPATATEVILLGSASGGAIPAVLCVNDALTRISDAPPS